MSRSEFTSHTPFTAPLRPTAPTIAATAATPIVATAATFATASNMRAARALQPAAFAATPASAAQAGAAGNATFRQVHADIARYLAATEAPATDAAGAGSALTADGAALRARLAARAIGGNDAGSVSEEAQQAFLQAIRPHAEAAAARLGVAPELVAAHAALESGWGRHAPGNNMFGIKAGASWQGAAQALATLEVENGTPVARNERFRAYGDTAGSFDDYAGLLLDNPRYRRALNTGGDAQAFAQALQAGGYATDPTYADKLGRVAASIKASQAARPSLPR